MGLVPKVIGRHKPKASNSSLKLGLAVLLTRPTPFLFVQPPVFPDLNQVANEFVWDDSFPAHQPHASSQALTNAPYGQMHLMTERLSSDQNNLLIFQKKEREKNVYAFGMGTRAVQGGGELKRIAAR